jgi:ABC-type nickel/cobalt efflux system permease component RcnA
MLFRKLGACLSLLCMMGFTPLTWAHPMGNFSVNHYTKIDLQSDRITVQYFIDLAEIPTYQEMQQGEIQADAKDPVVTRYIANRGRELGLGLSLSLNGEMLPMHMTSSGVIFPPGAGGLPTLKMGFTYEAAYPIGMDRTKVRLRYMDNNFPGHTGWKEIVAVASAGSLISSSVPATDRSDALNNYPTDLLNSPPQALEATLVATLLPISDLTSEHTAAASKDRTPSSVPAQAAVISQSTSSAMITAKPVGRAVKTEGSHTAPPTSHEAALPPSFKAATTPNASLTMRANQQQTPRSKFTELITAPHMSAWFLLTAAFIAIGLGGLHALEPGHGKTIVAAYLVGSRGTAAHAALLGLIVTISHTAGVFALGAITLYASRYIVPEQLYPWLGLFSGLTIVVLGCYMALRRLTGMASDHSHLSGESHSHWSFFTGASSESNQKRAETDSARPVSLTQLVVLGVTGGIIPCPAALIVLLSALALHRIGLGFFLIVAFSVGLAAVLIGFGMLMVFARRFMSRMAVDGPLTQWWLPLASSVFITVLGIALVVQAVSAMNVHMPVISHDKISGLLLVIGLGLILGMRHSTDADHVVAISTIITRQKSIRGAAIVGSVWGLGHTITVFIVGSMIILFKVEIPPRVGLSMEFCVALMLVLLGALNLSGAMQKITQLVTPARVVETAIPDSGQPFAPRSWLSLPGTSALGQLGIYQCIRPLVIGLVHGLAGSAAVALLVLSTIHNPLWATVYLLIFGAGTMLGMMVMTTAMATSLNFAGQRYAAFSRYLGTVSGMVSLCFGSFLVFQLGIMGGLFTSHPVWIPR